MAIVARPGPSVTVRLRFASIVLAGAALLATCSSTAGPASSRTSPSDTAATSATAPIHLVFLGDVMLGRGVAVVAAADPGSIFERLRPMLIGADLAFANLESPFTTRPHVGTGFALEADPANAPLLADAGIDVVDLANNHATDAGPETVLDTRVTTAAAGIRSVGAGENRETAAAPLIEVVGGIRVGVLAFDLAGGTAAGAATPGVNSWDPVLAETAVRSLRSQVDVVVVGLHAGVEYLPVPDPVLQRVTEQLTQWGTDVVWGHGAHVAYPVTVSDGQRPAVVAAGLGNAVFDQHVPGTDTGTALEVLVDAGGVLAMRTGAVSIEAGRSSFSGWGTPDGDAVALDGEWWTPVGDVREQPSPSCAALDQAAIIARLPLGAVVVSSGCGRVSGTGTDELVVSYRRPMSTETLHAAFPGHPWQDAYGQSAHLAVMEPNGTMRWGAATLLDPIGSIAVCSGALALGFTTLADPKVIAAGVWTWSGFGFRTTPILTAPTSVGCADVDHNGTSEPVVRREVLT